LGAFGREASSIVRSSSGRIERSVMLGNKYFTVAKSRTSISRAAINLSTGATSATVSYEVRIRALKLYR
jgi:hypothetical protein